MNKPSYPAHLGSYSGSSSLEWLPMTRQLHTLSDVQIRHWIKASQPVAKSDGGGLTFTLSAAGTASWTLRYRIGGKRKEVTLGNYPDIGLSDARRIASTHRAAIDTGKDPAAEKTATKLASSLPVWTVKAMAEDYEAKRLTPGAFAEVTLYTRKQHLKTVIIPQIGKLLVTDVTGKDIVQMLRGSRRPWTVANQVLTTATKLFAHAAGLHIININPCIGVSMESIFGPRPPVKSRTMLSATDLRTLLSTVDTLGPANALALRILLATCVRTNELSNARWENVDLSKGSWFVPDEGTKTRRGFYVHLTPVVIDWFGKLKLLAAGSPFVLPSRITRNQGKPVTERTLWAAIDRAFTAGRLTVTKFTPHDTRSTAKGHMRNLGISEFDSERALNHAIGGVSGIYDVRTELPEKRAALEAWCDFLVKLSNPIVSE